MRHTKKKLLAIPFYTPFRPHGWRPPAFQDPPLHTPKPSCLPEFQLSGIDLQENSPTRLCYLESEVMSRLIVMMDLEISIKVLLKGMWSQHNACQNCLSLMTSNMCFWVAQSTANYFLLSQVQVKMFILVCCILIKSVLSG